MASALNGCSCAIREWPSQESQVGLKNHAMPMKRRTSKRLRRLRNYFPSGPACVSMRPAVFSCWNILSTSASSSDRSNLYRGEGNCRGTGAGGVTSPQTCRCGIPSSSASLECFRIIRSNCLELSRSPGKRINCFFFSSNSRKIPSGVTQPVRSTRRTAYQGIILEP